MNILERKMSMSIKRDRLKKVLSVALSLLMVLGTFCFFNPFKTTEAEAAATGKYHVVLQIDSGNDTGGWDWGNVTLKGKKNNGKGGEDQIHYGSDNKVNFKGQRNWYDGYTDLFPTSFVYNYSFGGGMTKREMKFTVRIYVNDVEVASQYHSANSNVFKTAKGTKTTNVDSGKYPYVNSVAIGGNNLSITVPGNGVTSAATANTSSATVYDQYGVEWYEEPDGYIISSNSGATTSESITGVSITGASGKDQATVSVLNAAKDWVSNGGNNYERNLYVRAYKSGKWSSAKTVTLTNCKVTSWFYNYSESTKDWTTLAQKTIPYYNYDTVTSPTVSRTGWEFNGWSTDKDTASGDLTISEKIKVDTTWYAQWTKTVTGRFNYLDESGNLQSYDSTGYLDTTDTEFDAVPYAAPSIITYDGRTFKFLGWRTDTTASSELTTDFTIPSNYDNNVNTVKNFYAVYSGDITFGFDGNGGVVSGDNKTQTQYLNAAGNVTSHTFDITGVTASLFNTDYAGWAETADANDELDANTTFTITTDKTVYAVYKCNVNFYNQGVLFDSQVITYRHNAVDPSPLPDTAPTSRPLKDFDDENEYFFVNWDKSLTITGHTAINAVFSTVPHVFVEINTAEYPVVKPTCTEEGKQTYECTHIRDDDGAVCHYIKTIILPATGHKWVEKAAKEPTCTEKGYTADKRCSVCGYVEYASEDVAALGHAWGDYIETDSDCKTNGCKVRYCERCHAEDTATKVIKPLDSTKHKEITVPGTAATCTENGMTDYTICETCGAILKAGNTIITEGHLWDITPAVAPTCEEVGYTMGKVCSVCGEIGAVRTEIPAIGHNYYLVEAKAATCTENGNTSGYVCKNCGEGYNGYSVIPALGHDFVDLTVTKEATCSEEGLKEGGCSRCNAEHVEEVIPKLPHTPEVIEAVAATCSTYGYTEGEKCSVCGTVTVEPEQIKKLDHTWEKLSDGQAATCTALGVSASYKCSVCGAIKGGEIIAQLNHSYSVVTTDAASCNVAGTKYLRCGNCGDTKTEVIPALTHNWEIVPEQAATCTENGYTSGERCTICGEWNVEPETISATGHSFGDELTLDATCTAEGKKYKVCSVCGEEEIIEVLEKADHTVEVIPAVTATCTKNGKTAGEKCSVCGEILTAPVNVEPTAHVEVVYAAAKAATCSTAGNTEGVKCADCGKIITKAKNTAACEHKLTAWTTVYKATCTTAGKQERHCTECNYTEYNTLNAIGHSYSAYVTVYEPSCENTGMERSVCSRCTAVQDKVIPALGHTEVACDEVPATCEFDGTAAGTKCSVCGVTLSGLETIPAIGHKYVMSEHVDGGCENDSYDIYVCTHDETHTKIDNVVAAPGHEGGTATCTVKAVCGVCGEEYGDFAPHNYEKVVTAPTCVRKGYTTYTCTDCGDEYTADETAATGVHKYNEGTVITAPGCTTKGSKLVKCTVCGHEETVAIDAKGHNVTEWTVNGSTATGTCTECNETVTRAAEESDYKECERCGLRHTRTTGLMKYKGIVCSLRYFFRQIAKFFKGGD